ncbi:MAG: right-handed parallel beta-helix repeat-containing protein, partial [Myxococcota bacterium]
GADTIVVPAGTIALGGLMRITTDVTIRGSNALPSVLDASATTSLVFDIVTVGRLTIENLTLRGTRNAAVLANGDLIATDCVFEDNDNPGEGGAVFISDTGTGSFTRCLFQNNRANFEGAGAVSVRNAATFVDCSFIGNQAPIYGGAIYLSNGTSLVVRSSYFERNVAGTVGGAIATLGDGQSVSVSNSTFYANASRGQGGAVVLSSSNTTFAIDHSTFVDNWGEFGGGATRGPIELNNSLFAGNRSSMGNDACLDTPTGSNNVVEGTCTLNGANNQVGVVPLVGGPANLGGFTPSVPVSAGSPAIGASDCTNGSGAMLPIDGRGFLRPTSACTAGAFEYQVDALLVTTAAEPPGANCPSGGVVLRAGTDLDADGALDGFEVTSTDYLCAGLDAIQPLIGVDLESPGQNCPVGGHIVGLGFDDNRNGVLDGAEVTTTFYVCDGTDGTDGQSSLVDVVDEPAGNNCASGGVRIDAGLDDGRGGGLARNGILESGEVSATRYVCDGTDGVSALVDVVEEPPGANCPNGGSAIRTGLDDGAGGAVAGDGMLDDGEVDATDYLCDGADGTDGENGRDGADGVDGEAGGCSTTGHGASVFGLLLGALAIRRRR